MKHLPILTLTLSLLAAPAFGATKADPACSGSKLLARGTLFLAFALSGEPMTTGDANYDQQMREGVKKAFGRADIDVVQGMLNANPNLVPTLAVKSDELRARGLKGSRYMQELVNYFVNPDNGLCRK